MGRLKSYLWRYWRRYFLGAVCLLGTVTVVMWIPWWIREAVRIIEQGGSPRDVTGYALTIVAAGVVQGIIRTLSRSLIFNAGRDIEYDLRNDLFAHLTRLTPRFYSTHRTGDIMSRATNDLNAVRMMVGPGIMYWFDTFVILVAAVVIMGSLDWRLTFFVMLPVPAISFTVGWFGRIIHDRFQRLQALFSDISSRVQENLAGVRIVRAYAQEAAERKQFRVLNQEYVDENLKLTRAWGSFYPLLEVLIGLTFVIVLWLGGRQVMRGVISLGSFVMFTTYMGLLIWPMIALGWVVNLMQRGAASLERINQLLHEPPEIDDRLADQEREWVRGEIEFCGVSAEAANTTPNAASATGNRWPERRFNM